MELSYENADALVRSIGGNSAKHLAGFIDLLVEQQYSVSYVCQLARQTFAFGRWCEHRGVSLHALRDDDIARYQRERAKVWEVAVTWSTGLFWQNYICREIQHEADH